MSLLTFSMSGIGQPRTLAPTSGAARWLEPGVRGCGFRAVALSLRGPFASTPFVGRRCLVRLLVMEAPRTTWLSTHSQRGRGFSSPATGGGCGLLMAELAVCPRAHVVPATAGASSGEGHSRCPCEWPSGHWLERTQVSPWHWGGLVSPNALTGRAGVSLSSRREGGECGSGCGRPRKSANRSSSGSPAGKRCRASHI